MLILDNLGIHTPTGSRLLRWLLAELGERLADAQAWARSITPAEVLSQIGSPFALDQQSPVREELNHAA
jgi:hypothetical protein